MGFLDRLLGRESRPEQFSQQFSVSDPAFAQWWFGTDDSVESVTPYTVMGLSAVLRAVSIISTTIADLPLRTYERQGDEKVRVPSVFDNPYPGRDGLVPFAWAETVLMHLLLWREAFLWHEARDVRTGFVTSYRPVCPDDIAVKWEGGKRVFEYTEDGEKKTVGSEQVTYIPGPSLDGVRGHPLLHSARAVFSAAISGDKTAQRMLRRGIRLGGLVTPADGEEDFDQTEGDAILEALRAKAMGSDNAGDVIALNRKVKLQNWTASNIESQWDETRKFVLMEIEQLFGPPPHLMADTEKQTSWGTGVAEQNLGLQRFTLKGWSTRFEQWLSLALPGEPGEDGEQFVEFDYRGLLQGTPTQEAELVIKQLEAGLISLEFACQVLNLPAPTPAQQAVAALRGTPQPLPITDQQGVA